MTNEELNRLGKTLWDIADQLRGAMNANDCLASIDALITAQGEKVEAIKARKKGLMQKLFPQDME